jgi:hypothetical protein
MRTTIDVPPTLMRAAKARGLPSAPKAKAGRVTLPLIGRGAAPEVLITNEDIAAALDADDIARYGAR